MPGPSLSSRFDTVTYNAVVRRMASYFSGGMSHVAQASSSATLMPRFNNTTPFQTGGASGTIRRLANNSLAKISNRNWHNTLNPGIAESKRAYVSQVSRKPPRPGFSSDKKKASRLEATLATGKDYTKANLSEEDLAAPHRAPYALIRDTICNGSEKDISSLTDTLLEASRHCREAFMNVKSDSRFHELGELYKKTEEEVSEKLETFKKSKTSLDHGKEAIARSELVKAMNNLASNAPGLGPHSDVNAIVSDRLHLHPTDITSEPLTPRSRAALKAFPQKTLGTTSPAPGVRLVVSTTGALHSLAIQNPVSDVNVGKTVVRGALFVDKFKRVYKPKNPYQAPTGVFDNDWELVQ